MRGRAHMRPTTVASKAIANPPMPLRMKRPRRSKRLNDTASALVLPRFANQLFPDVALEFAEVIVTVPYFAGPEFLDRGVILSGDVAEVLHGALVGPGQAVFAVRDAGWRPGQRTIERDVVIEIGRGRGDADALVRLPVPLQHDVAGVLDFGHVVGEGAALVLAPADELLIVLD